MKRQEEANFFIDLAIEKTKTAIASGEMDAEAMDIFLTQKTIIDKLPEQSENNLYRVK